MRETDGDCKALLFASSSAHLYSYDFFFFNLSVCFFFLRAYLCCFLFYFRFQI